VTAAEEQEPPDLERTEELADVIVRACQAFGATREEVAAATSAVFANHAFATGVTEWRAVLSVRAMYSMRRGRPPTTRLLVKAPK
jgi:hypothetical protein